MAIDPAALWRVPVQPADQDMLDRAFTRAPELWPRLGVACGGLATLGLEAAFVTGFVTRLRQQRIGDDPTTAVLTAALAALEELPCQR